MGGGQRLISWFHPWYTSNVALNTRTCAHGPLMSHPNWAGCDNYENYRLSNPNCALKNIMKIVCNLSSPMILLGSWLHLDIIEFPDNVL
jgi:hypothetical protein